MSRADGTSLAGTGADATAAAALAGQLGGGKRVKGRKRYLLVESMGLLLAVVVTAAKLTSKGCRLCCAGSSSGEAGSIGCGSSGATGLLGANAGRVGLGTLPLHAGSAGAAPRPCFPSGAPTLVRGAHLGLDFPVPAAQPG